MFNLCCHFEVLLKIFKNKYLEILEKVKYYILYQLYNVVGMRCASFVSIATKLCDYFKVNQSMMTPWSGP